MATPILSRLDDSHADYVYKDFFGPIFLANLFVARRVENVVWTTESEHSWFGSILSFYIPTDNKDDRSSEDLKHFSDRVFTVLHALCKNMATNTRLTMGKCCEWLVEDLKSKGLSAADMFDTEQMASIYRCSDKNASIYQWICETAAVDQKTVIDDV